MVSKDHVLAWLTLDGVMVLLHAEKHVLQPRGCGMDGFVLNHLQGLMVVFYDNMPAV